MGIRALDLLEIHESPAPRIDFTFHGLKAGTIGLLASAGGTGKSMFALQLACSLTTISDYTISKNIVDNEHKGISVSYLSLEDPTDILKVRLKYIFEEISRQQSDHTIGEIATFLKVFDLYGTGFQITDNEQRNIRVFDSLEKVASVSHLVIIDTLRRFHAFEENSNEAMSMLFSKIEAICRNTNASFLFLHHTNKASFKEDEKEQNAIRGASALVDNARLAMTLNVVSEKEAEKIGAAPEMRKNHIKLSFAKVNYAPPVPDLYFKRLSGGVLVPYSPAKTKKRRTNEY